MRSGVPLLLALATTSPVLAAPYEKRWSPTWPSLGKSSSQQTGKSSYLNYERDAATMGNCDTQQALQYMDLSAVSPALPQPAALSLFQVALGRGTQNYTCDLSNATATPVAVGALATLYNFNCVAAERPNLMRQLPRIALNHNIPSCSDTDDAILNAVTSGHHYFIDSTTPFFNMDTGAHKYGMGALAKANASDAPAGAPVGQKGEQGYGAVQWLRLDQKAFAEDQWKAVYRLNTAGGDPPKTCTDMPGAFEVPYAAEYWLFT